MRNRNSLALKIALLLAVILAVTMGFLTVYLSDFLRASYLDLLRENLISQTLLVADRVAGLVEQDADRAALQDETTQISKQIAARVTIIDPAGVVLADSSAPVGEMENHLNRPEVQVALQGRPNGEVRYSETLQTEMLYTAAPIHEGSATIGIARLAVPLRVIQRNQAALIQTLSIATGAAALAAILTGLLISWYMLKPLKQLSDTAVQVASGQVSDILVEDRRDEIGQLQQSIHLMASHLNEQIAGLHAERAKLNAVLSNMTDGLMVVDSAGKVRMINEAAVRLFGVDKDEAVDRSLIEVVRHHQLFDLWQECRRTGQQQSTTLETTPDRLFVHGIASPLREASPGTVLLVFQDLTRVRRLETVRRDFVSNVSHELRTPLASLKALTETLQEGALEDPPAARRFLQRMETEIDNLTQMVRELLELSRIESGRVPFRMLTVAPCVLVAHAVERMQIQAERAGLEMTMDCPDTLPPVRADAERIDQVLVNLIHNAVKFTPPGGSIHIAAEQRAERVVITVRDTGTGIAAELLPRIFERFYKADRSRSGSGTGLGLSIARHIVEAHGGQIWAESQQGKGSTFFVSLPTA